jgi:oligosaccharyltransferase complex subunit beta
MDPFIRQTLTHDSNGVFSTSFTIPDVYGVFKFSVEHRHLGYSSISSTTRVSHRGHPRILLWDFSFVSFLVLFFLSFVLGVIS